MKIVQITDTHFRAEETTVHWGYRSQATYRTFLEAVAEGHADVDMVVITGDCVACYPVEEDPAFSPEGEPAYRLLRSMAEEQLPGVPLRALPGNHDSREHLSRVFPESAGGGALAAPPGTHCFAETLGGWLLVGLDSQCGDPLDPNGEGELGDAQLDWLRRALTAHPAAPAVLFLHHPPTHNTPTSFTEAGAEALEAVVEAHASQIRAVVAGHIHADFTTDMLGGVPLLATPSGIAQSRIDEHTGLLLGGPVDVEHGPGFRVLELAEQGSVETHVERPAMQPGWAVFEELRLGPRMASRPGAGPDLLISCRRERGADLRYRMAVPRL